MATPSHDASIEDVLEDLQLHEVILQSLDEQRPDAAEEREEIMETIKDLEMRLARLRGDPSPHPPQNHQRPPSSYLETPDPYPRMHPAQLDGGGFDVSPFGESPPRWVHSPGSPPPTLPSASHTPGGDRSSGPFPVRKRRHATESSSDYMQPPMKRVVGNEPPRPSSPAASTSTSEQFGDGADELRRLLGLDNEDTMMAFQDEQRKAEQWLKERKDQERRDEEYARMLHDNLSEQPRPASARSFASTNYSGSSLPFPEPPTEPVFGDANPSFPPYNQPAPASTSHTQEILSRPPFAKGNILPDPRSLPGIGMRQPVPQPSSELFKGDSDDSDIQEITPKDFRPSLRTPSYPSHGHPYNSSGLYSRNMPEPPRILPWDRSSQPFCNPVYSPYGASSSSSDSPGLGPMYGPSVLQNTMARLNAGRNLLQQAGRSIWGGLPGALPSQKDPYSYRGGDDPISQTMNQAFRNGPLDNYSSIDYIKYDSTTLP